MTLTPIGELPAELVESYASQGEGSLKSQTDGAPYYWGNRYLGRDGKGKEPTFPAWSRHHPHANRDSIPYKQPMGRFYFYKISFSRHMQLEFEIHEGVLLEDEVMTKEAMKAAIQKIVKDRTQPKYTDPDDVSWGGPGYIAFMLDVENWAWLNAYQGDDTSKPLQNYALHFAAIYEKSGVAKYHANQSFFNATEFPATDDPAEKRMVLFCENHHTRADGIGPREPGCKVEKYKADLFCRVNVKGVTGRQETIIIDPSGRNTGP